MNQGHHESFLLFYFAVLLLWVKKSKNTSLNFLTSTPDESETSNEMLNIQYIIHFFFGRHVAIENFGEKRIIRMLPFYSLKLLAIVFF